MRSRENIGPATKAEHNANGSSTLLRSEYISQQSSEEKQDKPPQPAKPSHTPIDRPVPDSADWLSIFLMGDGVVSDGYRSRDASIEIHVAALVNLTTAWFFNAGLV